MIYDPWVYTERRQSGSGDEKLHHPDKGAPRRQRGGRGPLGEDVGPLPPGEDHRGTGAQSQILSMNFARLIDTKEVVPTTEKFS